MGNSLSDSDEKQKKRSRAALMKTVKDIGIILTVVTSIIAILQYFEVTPKGWRKQEPPTQQTSGSGLGVKVTGQNTVIRNRLIEAIKTSGFTREENQTPDVTVEIFSDRADVYNAAGKLRKSVPADNTVTANVMNAIEGIYLVRQFSALENPNAHYAVELWMDEPGKVRFKAGDRVTLYYRISRLPTGKKAFLTLLNVSPDGTVSILYPRKADFTPNAAEKLYLNAEVEPGTVHSIPKTSKDLMPGQNVAIDLRIRLEEGQEYFKAITTSEPVTWEKLNINVFQTRFKGKDAKMFADSLATYVRQAEFWSAGSLSVEAIK